MYMTIEEQNQVLRSFKNFDKSNDGMICKPEFAGLLKEMGRDDVSADQIDGIFGKYDLDSNGQLCFQEYLKMCMELSENRKNFGKQHSKKQEELKLESDGSTFGYSSYSHEERRTFTKLFNSTLAKDPYVGERMPINPDNEDVWYAL